ncbi:hypothetical protein [Helicobacter cetorum]|uniref:hypothetical protein n=1 Tax=Helicobacter cetorum TaxID=138563 RepID=UPI000CF05366|nr:hypothetical protein [Helicobacter cetorum]
MKSVKNYARKIAFAVSLTCLLTNTINADDRKPTLREICVKAIKSCDGYSQKKFDYFENLPEHIDRSINFQETLKDYINEISSEDVEKYYKDRHKNSDFEISHFQKCVANRVAEAQRTGWDTAGDIALGTAGLVGDVALGALELAGSILGGVAKMLPSSKTCFKADGKKYCVDENYEEDDREDFFKEEKRKIAEQDKDYIKAVEQKNKEIARDKTILANCNQAIKR